MIELLIPFLQGTIRTATPLALAALGETVTERAGIINIGLEGSIIAGALAALLTATASPWPGFLGAAMAGILVSAIFAVFTIHLKADQIITGTAITLLSLGLTGTFYRLIYGIQGVALTTPTLLPTPIPLLDKIPIVGETLFTQSTITYLLYLLIPIVWWWMYKTHPGLALRAIGENPAAATASGISVSKHQLFAVLFGGFCGGVSGAVLVLVQAGTFAEGMSAGRGFIAVAIVVLGRWHPIGVALAALMFGAASALQYFFQAMAWNVPYQLFLALPYFLTLVALATAKAHTKSPANAEQLR